MPKIQLEDGTILQFDGNYNQKQISDAVDEYVSSTRQNQQAQPAEPQQEASFLEKAGNFAQGVPQGLGNKFVGAVQAATGVIAPDSQFAHNLADQVKNLNQRQSQLPVPERAGIVGGEIVGDLAATAASPLARGAGFVGNAAASGAISGLTAPLEDSSNSARLGEVAKDAAGGAAFGSGLQLIGKGAGAAKEGVGNIVKGIKARLPEELQVVGQALKKGSSDLYTKMRDLGSTINPNKAQAIPQEIENDLLSKVKKFDPDAHGKTVSLLNRFKEEAQTNNLGLDDLDRYRKLFRNIELKDTDIKGVMGEEGYVAGRAISKIDDIIDNLKPKDLANFKYTSQDLKEAVDEGFKLEQLESHLIGNVRGNSKATSLINEEANQKLGFFRNRARKEGSEFINRAAEDATFLPNIRKQIVNQENLIKEIHNNLSTTPEIAQRGQQAKDLLLKARGEWKQARKFEKISDIAEKAAGDPQRIKILTKSFINNKKNLYGFTGEEKSALKHIANGNFNEKVLRFLGGAGIDANNKLLPFLVGSGSFVAGGPVGTAAIIGVGTAARQAQKYLARGKLDDALKIIQSSAEPAKVIAKIPNRKIQEKLLNQLFARGGAAAISEGSQDSSIISEANAAQPTMEELRKQFIQEAGPTKYVPTDEELSRYAAVRRKQKAQDTYKKEMPYYQPSNAELERFARARNI